MRSIFEDYAKYICTTCKGKCNKGICMVYDTIIKVKCIDYVKDETKIKPPEQILITRAKQNKPIMKKLI